MRRLLAITVFLVFGACIVPVAAQTPMRVTAQIDDQGITTFGRIDVPAGSIASDFKVEMRTMSPTTTFNAPPSVAITSVGGGSVFFTRQPTSYGQTNDAPLPASQLVLQAGTYELRPGGGRRTYVAVEFMLSAPSFSPGPGQITALLDANCGRQDATLTVPAGMQAINLRIHTDASGLPCTPGTLPPPMEARLEGPGFVYQWSQDKSTNTANEWPAAIGTLQLPPGTYTLRTGLGKLTQTTLWYELVPLPGAGDVVNMNLPPALWEPVTEGQGSAWVDGNDLHVDSEGPSAAWFRTLRPYDFDQPYTVELDFRVNVDNGHWVWIYSDGFIDLHTDWNLDFGHLQPGAAFNTKTFARLTKNRWYQLRVDAQPQLNSFAVYLDGFLAATATGIEPQMSHVHGPSFGNTDPDAIYFGDADTLAMRGGGYNHGNVTVRAVRVSGASPPDSPTCALVNPSFEEGAPAGSFRTVSAGSNALTGWTVTQASVDLVGSYFEASDGNQSVDLNGSPGVGAISQTFPTVPGQSYRLTFDLAGNPDLGAHVMPLLVRVADKSQTFEVNTEGKTLQAMGWRTETIDFTATSNRTVLEFISQFTESPACGPVIDNVDVRPR